MQHDAPQSNTDMPSGKARLGRHLAGWLITSLAVAFAYVHLTRPDLRLWPGVVTHGNTAARAAALTFDDGPHPLWTPLLADTLQRHGAHGTFFVVGMEAQRYPELIARLASQGHEVASHSLTHPYPNLTGLPAPRVQDEIRKTSILLKQLTGAPVRYFRPPGGGINDVEIMALQQQGLQLAGWSQNIADWDSPTPAIIRQRLQRHMRPGLIVLLHQRGSTVAALEEYLAAGQPTDYTYTTYSSLLRH